MAGVSQLVLVHLDLPKPDLPWDTPENVRMQGIPDDLGATWWLSTTWLVEG